MTFELGGFSSGSSTVPPAATRSRSAQKVVRSAIR
jgi:hypothetical protein